MKKNNKNILIINTVAVNGGDEALLRATIKGLNTVFDAPKIKVLSNNPILCRKYFSDISFDWDWEYAFKNADDSENKKLFQLKKRIRIFLKKRLNISFHQQLSLFFSSNREKRVYNIFNESDIILLGAGGYIHDFYGYNKRLETIDFLHNVLKKPYYFFSQSVGPFWNQKNYKYLIEAFKNSQKIILREKISEQHLNSIGYKHNNIVTTNDIAFNLYSEYKIDVDLTKSLKKIIINFREWNFNDDIENDFNKAVDLCKYLILKNYKLTFISTCQGIEGYVDDSLYMNKIINTLTIEERGKCNILSEKYSLTQFLNILKKHDAYIGMRLHGAILSLIAGIPAFNLSYEDKSTGVFESLNLSNFCCPYNLKSEIIKNKIEYFESNYNSYLNNIEETCLKASESVKINFEHLLEK